MNENDELEIELESPNESVDINEENYVYINVPEEVIEELQEAIALRALIAEAGAQIELAINSSTFVLTAKLKDKNGNLIYTSNGIDLPIESMIVDGSYNEQTKKIVLTLQSGTTIEVSLADLISGLVSETALAQALENYYTKLETYNKTETDEKLAEKEAEIQKIQALNQRLLNQYDQKQASGESIDITDGADLPLAEFGLGGKSDQKTTEGNQLVDFGTLNKSSGLTYSFVDDILTMSGEGTSLNCNKDITDLVKANPGKTLKFVYEDIDVSNQYGANVAYIVVIENGVSTTERLLLHNLTNTPYTIPSDTTNISSAIFRVVANGYSSTSYNASLTITKPMLQFGEEEKAYEQYTGGQPSPNPNYEQPVNSVGDNVNLFDKDNANIINGYVTSTKIEGASATRMIYISCKPNTTYAISKILTSRFRVATTSEIPANEVSTSDYISNDTGTSIIITTGPNAEYLCVFCYASSYDTTLTFQDVLDSLKIEEGSEVSKYTAYGLGCAIINKFNKNLLDIKNNLRTLHYGISYSYDKGFVKITGTATNTYSYMTELIKTNLKAGIYTFSINKSLIHDIALNLYDYNSILIEGIRISTGAKTNTFTATEDIGYLRISIATGTGVTFDEEVAIMLEKNSTASSIIENENKTYIIPTQQPMRSIGEVRDDFIKQNGSWYERHKIEYIESYNGETITTEYMSTTGELTIGASVQYISDESILLPCTNEQSTILEQIIEDGTYKEVTHYFSEDDIEPVIDVTYRQDVHAVQNKRLDDLEARLALLE